MSREDAPKKVADFIKGNLLNFIVIATSFTYLFFNEIVFNASVSIEDATASTLVGIVCGLIIKQALGESGFVKAYNSPLWVEANTKYKDVCNTVNDFIDRVDNFYACEQIELKKQYRRVNLVSGQMRYSWFFNENGEYIENPEKYEKLTKKQKHILKNCIKVKIYTLNLFSECSAELKNCTAPERTDTVQRTKGLTKNIVFTLVASLIGGFFSASFTNWSWADFIIAIIQIIIWISCGVMQLYANYNFIIIEKINILARKKEQIMKFKKGCENNLYLTNPYDELEEKEVKEND